MRLHIAQSLSTECHRPSSNFSCNRFLWSTRQLSTCFPCLYIGMVNRVFFYNGFLLIFFSIFISEFPKKTNNTRNDRYFHVDCARPLQRGPAPTSGRINRRRWFPLARGSAADLPFLCRTETKLATFVKILIMFWRCFSRCLFNINACRPCCVHLCSLVCCYLIYCVTRSGM